MHFDTEVRGITVLLHSITCSAPTVGAVDYMLSSTVGAVGLPGRDMGTCPGGDTEVSSP